MSPVSNAHNIRGNSYIQSVQLEKPPTFVTPPHARDSLAAPLCSLVTSWLFLGVPVKSVHARAPVYLKTEERAKPQDGPLGPPLP